MTKKVIIDCFPESVLRYRVGYAIVAIDVIRATTTAVTAAAEGWRCLPVPGLASARTLARQLDQPVLAGELGGNVPAGFDMDNSPAELVRRSDNHRPLILLSSSGTKLICEAARCDVCYLASFRNWSVLPGYLSQRHPRVAVIGAGSRAEFRQEDQMCCAWIAEALIRYGYAPENEGTLDLVRRWSSAPVEACLASPSVDYLRRTNQLKDLTFILHHINDLREIFSFWNGQVVMTPFAKRPSAGSFRQTQELEGLGA